MSTQKPYGFVKTRAGSIPMGGASNTALTDGQNDQELLTNKDYTVVAQSLGTFAEGQTVTHMSVTAATGMCFSGILRNGQYIGICQSLGSNAYGGQPKYSAILPGPVKLVAGDQVIIRTEA